MTLLPVEAQRISYVGENDLPDYEFPEQCAQPECDFPAFERHHVVRRSYTQGTGPQTWIKIDGQLMPNLVGLCRHHHYQITNNQAKISWHSGQWVWAEKPLGAKVWVSQHALHPVPLIESASDLPSWTDGSGGALSERGPDHQEGALRADSRSTNSEGGRDGSPPAAGYGSSPAAPAPSETPSTSPSEMDKCPTCQRKMPKPKSELEPTRPKATWSIKVPVDERENGYALLRDLVEQCQHDLGREGEPPYFTLIEVFYAFLTSAKERVA